MDKRSSTLYVLIVALCALVHFGTVFCTATLRSGGISTAKPGVCPVRFYIRADCNESCSKDSDCHDNEKCCSNGCGHECMAPVIVKPGVCPLRLPAAFGPCVESCSTDSDCHDNEKCCFKGCGHECMAPVTVKPGVCPLRHPPAFGPCVESCSKDSDCHNNEKCCYNGCGHVCMAPYIVKPGVCPLRRLDDRRCAESCSNDNDCPNNEKCCFSGCGHQCIEPYLAKPGECPLMRSEVGLCVESCSYDSDCPNNEKCCSNGCGHHCIEPYLVLPPKPECPQHLNFALSRKGCEDCPTDHICCVYNGEEVCVPTVFTKPGVCPLMRSEVGPCVASCSYDNDCPNNEKCCSNGCGRHCIEPYPVWPVARSALSEAPSRVLPS
ncbi:keratin-associated protein 5-1-like [Oreochromis aureus]|uniref:keratin-associated protein 5-1-like n=1 Tax=Oreochromis aureus TaxID=47969 RepID=UPI00195469A5|nr:keratin-associated protein 5-1-like [Oreochromis aureus]